MALQIGIATIDHSAEVGVTKLYVPDLTNANYDALFGVAGKVTLLQAAFLLLTDCTHKSTNASLLVDQGAGTIPGTVTAQREIGVRVTYRDTVNGKMSELTVPGPKTGFYPGSGSDVIPLDNILAAAFITVFEANAVSADGNAVEVTNIRLVGRNN